MNMYNMFGWPHTHGFLVGWMAHLLFWGLIIWLIAEAISQAQGKVVNKKAKSCNLKKEE